MWSASRFFTPHGDAIEDLIAKGRDIKKAVLSRAVRWQVKIVCFFMATRRLCFSEANACSNAPDALRLAETRLYQHYPNHLFRNQQSNCGTLGFGLYLSDLEFLKCKLEFLNRKLALRREIWSRTLNGSSPCWPRYKLFASSS